MLTFKIMKLLNEFPEVTEGLEGEVRVLYKTATGSKGEEFSQYFAQNSGSLSLNEEEAKKLD